MFEQTLEQRSIAVLCDGPDRLAGHCRPAGTLSPLGQHSALWVRPPSTLGGNPILHAFTLDQAKQDHRGLLQRRPGRLPSQPGLVGTVLREASSTLSWAYGYGFQTKSGRIVHLHQALH